MSQLYNKAHTITTVNDRTESIFVDIKNFLDGSAISLVGSTLTLSVQATLGDPNKVIEVSNSTHLDAVNGLSVLKIPKVLMSTVDKGNYFYELTLQNAIGEIYTVTISDFIVAQGTGDIVLPNYNPVFSLFADTIAGANNSLVTSWSGFTQGTVANQPILKTNYVNGRNAVYFDGVNDFLQSANTSNYPNMSIFAVYLPEDFTNFQSIISKNSGDGYTLLNTTGLYYVQGGSSVFSTNPPTANAWNVSSVDLAGVNAQHYLNNVANGSGSVVTRLTPANPWTVSNSAGAFGTLKGYLGALLVYDKVLTSAERTTVFNYLKQYYQV